jgi:hypothetical protein
MRFSKEVIENFVFGNFPEAKYVSGDSGEIHFNTPFDTDKKRRLYVSSDTGKWFDQKAQRGGNKFEFFVSEYLDVSVKEAVSILLGEYGDGESYVPVKKEEVKKVKKKKIEIPKGVKMFNSGEDLGYVGNMALEYLNSRKISPEGLGYISSDDAILDKRIFIPFYEEEELVYYIARSFLPDEKLRYKNPSGFSAGDFVFNLDKIIDEVFIFEGVFDALSLGFPQVGTAMLSSVIKDEQARKILSKNPRRIILVPDKDEKIKVRITILDSLIKTAEKLLENKKYKQDFTILVYDLPEGYKDFNEYKMSTGIGNIPLDECKVFNKTTKMMELADLRMRR